MNSIQLFAENTELERAKAQSEIDTSGTGDLIIQRRNNSASIKVRPKQVVIGRTQMMLDPSELIRMIKRVTQTIGEYKNQSNPYSKYIIHAMRKARADMCSDLEHHFHIHWEINSQTGESSFYM